MNVTKRLIFPPYGRIKQYTSISITLICLLLMFMCGWLYIFMLSWILYHKCTTCNLYNQTYYNIVLFPLVQNRDNQKNAYINSKQERNLGLAEQKNWKLSLKLCQKKQVNSYASKNNIFHWNAWQDLGNCSCWTQKIFTNHSLPELKTMRIYC